MTPVNDKYFHVNDNRCVSQLYCFYVCVLCFSVPFSRKLSCFLRRSRVPYSWTAPSGSSIPGDPSSVTSGLRIPGIETKPIHPEIFRLWMTNSDSDVAHDSLFGESQLSEISESDMSIDPQFLEGSDPRIVNPGVALSQFF